MNNKIAINLELSDIEIIEVNIDEKGNYHINIRSTKTTGTCHKCNCEIDKLHSYDREMEIRHLPIFEKECYLHIKLPRYQCDSCHKQPKTTQQVSWRRYNSSNSKDFENYILKSLVNSTVSDVSRKENIGEGVVSRILESYYPDKIDWENFDNLGQIGIDEIALKKGHKDFVTIVSSRVGEEIRIIGVLKDRKKATILEFFKEIPKKLKETVNSVCSDLYDGFINAAIEVFGKKIRIVIDRFHVAKLYRKSVDNVRKQEMKRLRKELSKKEYDQLKNAMWVLRKPESELTDRNKFLLIILFKHSEKLKKVYELSQDLTDIFETQTTRNGGIRRLKNWIKKVQNSTITSFNTFVKTLSKRLNEIANYFVKRESSGFVEGINNRIKVLKRRCYGIVDRVSLFRRISLDMGNKHLLPILINK
jgi:transposase